MTSVSSPPAEPEAPTARSRPGSEGPRYLADRRRLLLHGGLLTLVLVGCLWFTQPTAGSWSVDEGVVVLQAEMLERGDGWVLEYESEVLDPEVVARPFVRSSIGEEGIAPYVRHPLYPLLLAGTSRLFGDIGFWVPSLLAAVGAAFATALIAGRLDRRLSLPALWLTGLASPLLFDAQIVLAHTLGAAAVGLAALGALTALSRDRSLGRGLAALAVGLALAAALRGEGLFVGPAIAVGALVVARMWPELRRRALATAGVAIAASTAAYLLERVVVRSVLGPLVSGPEASESAPWLSGRAEAFVTTLFDPSYGSLAGVNALLGAAIVLLAVSVVLVRLNQRWAWIFEAVVVSMVVVYCLRLANGPSLIPGLFVAFPVLWVGLWFSGPALWRTPARLLISTAGAALVAAVLLTQYSSGGGIEWGGRYFALALPLLIPTALLGFADAYDRGLIEPRRARRLVVLTVVVVLVTGAIGLQALRSTRLATDELVQAVDVAGIEAGPAGGTTDRPLVLSTWQLLPRAAWPVFWTHEWVTPPEPELSAMGQRLSDEGVERFVLVTIDPETEMAALEEYVEIERYLVDSSPPFDVVVMEHR